MFKVNNKNTTTTSMTLFWCFCCYFWTYFKPFSGVSIADFEQLNVMSEKKNRKILFSTCFKHHIKTIPCWTLLLQDSWEFYCKKTGSWDQSASLHFGMIKNIIYDSAGNDDQMLCIEKNLLHQGISIKNLPHRDTSFKNLVLH